MSKWVSVKDHQPKLSGWYLVWTTKMPSRLMMTGVPSAYFYSTPGGGWRPTTMGSVTHWMSLPPSPHDIGGEPR